MKSKLGGKNQVMALKKEPVAQKSKLGQGVGGMYGLEAKDRGHY